LYPLVTRLLFTLPLLFSSASSAAQAVQTAQAVPEVLLDLRIDPSTRLLTGQATWTIPAGQALTLTLDRRFSLGSITVDGAARSAAASTAPSTAPSPGPRHVIAIPVSAQRPQRWVIRWQGELAPLDAGVDHRGVIGALPPMASNAGGYLPAGSGWYPESTAPIRFRLSIELPAPQRAVVPGRLVSEHEDAQHTRTVFDSVQPIEGITLMTGPYRVDEKVLVIGARRIRLRTWFTEALQPLAADYLNAAAGYIERFDRSIGAYPFDGFSIVSSPLPTGFGFPGATYIGEAVLRLPFMRGQSLAHEILHSWWGNGVWVDWAGGNWSEGLTTYLADHALRGEQSTAAARQMRWGWLRDFAAIAPGMDLPLNRFTARTHGAASAVGYGKAAMLFHMVRGEIGDAAFEQALRDIWASHAGRRAGWRDLQTAFERRASRPLDALFAPMLAQAGAASITPQSAQWQSASRQVLVSWPGPAPITLSVPAIAWYGDTAERVKIEMRRGAQTSTLATREGRVPDALQVDPDFSVWRALGPGESPPLLRDLMLAADARVLVASDGDSGWRNAALDLAARMLEARPLVEARASDITGARPLLVIGRHEDIVRLTRNQPALARPAELARMPEAALWAARGASGASHVFVSVEDTAALIDLHRRAPHYGAQGFVGFRSAKVVTQGVGTIEVARVPVTR